MYSQNLFEVTVPVEWSGQSQLLAVLPVHPDSKEGQQVESLFHQTLQTTQLVSMRRIQNLWLWNRYSHCQDRMLLKGLESATGKTLFHGTTSTPPDQIYGSEHGFDFRVASPTALWGTGVYFATTARYSHAYAYTVPGTGHKQLIVAKVLTGVSCDWPQDTTLTRPPPKPIDAMPGKVRFSVDLYDSVHGQTSNSDIYVIYEHEKAYPAYLITYSV